MRWICFVALFMPLSSRYVPSKDEHMPLTKLMVTGTDTGVGKTLVSAGLCAWRVSKGLPVQALKPVESGTQENHGLPADASLLAQCTGQDEPHQCNVIALPEPLAPVVAARRAGVDIDMGPLDERFAELRSLPGALVVEGVGGALVEVALGVTVADLAARWHLPALVVAANRLGVLSHTLLTVEALERRDVPVLGVVLNTMDGEPAGLAEQSNAEELSRLLPRSAPLLGTIPFIPEAEREDPRALALATSALAGILWSAELENRR
jgi:dethiobiotin synthetase